jgi:hypothetical protein
MSVNLEKPIKRTLLLGDFITGVFAVVGIKQTVDFISKKSGEDCGCNKRTKELNDVGKRLINHFMRYKKDVSL